MKVTLDELLGNSGLIRQIDVKKYVQNEVGEPTLRDIIDELQKPGRDPRASFSPPKFRDDVNSLSDLKEGMSFEGIVTNVTAFGAFVDIGVHQDGLVHISELSDEFVKDPADVVKAGERLKVRVLSLDIDRKRISLSAKTQTAPTRRPDGQKPDTQNHRGSTDSRGRSKGNKSGNFSNKPFANLTL